MHASSTSARASAQDRPGNPKTFRERDAWVRAVLAADLPHAAVLLAIRIALHLHVGTGRCNPTFATLATETRLSERTVYRLVALLEQAGWIERQGTHGRYSTQYTLRDPDIIVSGLNTVTSDRVEGGEPCQRSVTPTLTKLRQTNPDTTLADKNSVREKRKRKAKEKDSPALFASPDSKQAEPTAAENENAFERFWLAYPRRVAKIDARKAFDKAVEHGANPETLIQGAKAYALERAGEPAQYTKHPATWLNKGCWSDEPPAGAVTVIDEEGNPVAIQQPQPQRRRAGAHDATWEKYLGGHHGKGN